MVENNKVCNGVYETATGDLLRFGYTDFRTESAFDSNTETYRTDVPVPAYRRYEMSAAQMHRWDGAQWILVAQPERPLRKTLIPVIVDTLDGSLWKVTVTGGVLITERP